MAFKYFMRHKSALEPAESCSYHIPALQDGLLFYTRQRGKNGGPDSAPCPSCLHAPEFNNTPFAELRK